jgi:hypothetical protein
LQPIPQEKPVSQASSQVGMAPARVSPGSTASVSPPPPPPPVPAASSASQSPEPGSPAPAPSGPSSGGMLTAP